MFNQKRYDDLHDSDDEDAEKEMLAVNHVRQWLIMDILSKMKGT